MGQGTSTQSKEGKQTTLCPVPSLEQHRIRCTKSHQPCSSTSTYHFIAIQRFKCQWPKMLSYSCAEVPNKDPSASIHVRTLPKPTHIFNKSPVLGWFQFKFFFKNIFLQRTCLVGSDCIWFLPSDFSTLMDVFAAWKARCTCRRQACRIGRKS